MNTRINKVTIYKLTLLLLPIIPIFISGCSLLGLEPSNEIVREAVRICANNCTPTSIDASGTVGQLMSSYFCGMRGEASIADFKITNKWKKSIDNETVFFYETQFKMIYPDKDINNVHQKKSCYFAEDTIQLVKRGKKWYSLTSKCASQRNEIDCGNDTSETGNSSATEPVQAPSENQEKGPNTSECLKSEPETVILSGKLERRTYPGSPNFENVNQGDEPETGFYLLLKNPVCYAGDEESDPKQNVSLVQLVLDQKNYDKLQPYLGKSIKLKGSLFGKHTGHHHAPILLDKVVLIGE